MIGGEFEDDTSIAVSRDSTSIAYARVDSDLTENTNTSSLWLMDRLHPDHPQAIVVEPPGPSANERFHPMFSPTSRDLAYLTTESKAPGTTNNSLGDTIAVRSLADATTLTIPLSGIPEGRLGEDFHPTAISAFRWHPDGARLGVVVTGRLKHESPEGVEASEREFSFADPQAAPARLAIYDLKTRQWDLISPTDIDVENLDWSPDGRRLAFSGSVGHKNALPYIYTDLYIADVTSRKVQKILTQPGVDTDPQWSPDGRWIAFRSQRGQVRWLGGTRVGLYNVAEQTFTYPGFDELGKISGFNVGFIWAPDSRSLLLRVPYHLSKHLFKLSLPSGVLTQFTQGDRNFYGARYTDGGRSIVFLSESFLRSPDLYESAAAEFRPRRLTDTNPALSLPSGEVRQVKWPSRDGKWEIHGWLLLPYTSTPSIPAPLLVYAEGGPIMAAPWFRIGGWHYPIHAFLANGVAILIPNSRGREGYGTEFEQAWETEKDYGRGALEDDLAGVEAMVRSGIADPERVALAGHSWGGYLAAYALTQTNGFKAVLVHEAVNLNMMNDAFAIAANPAQVEFAHQLGTGTPFEPGEADHIRNLSPLYQVSRASTPTLLEFGRTGIHFNDGYAFFAGLKHFKVPSELIGYPRSGHVTQEPELLYDSAQRDLEWFAYWVLGKPTKRMLDKYGAPKISEWPPNPSG